MRDLLLRLRDENAIWQYPDSRFELCKLAADELERSKAEIDSLRLTLGGRTFAATVPEPIGCPMPGACMQVREIERLRTALLRIVSLEKKNVPKYAQQIAREAVTE